jgi:hypothetical protein
LNPVHTHDSKKHATGVHGRNFGLKR